MVAATEEYHKCPRYFDDDINIVINALNFDFKVDLYFNCF
jgi:hypothetical protein